ncbi:MAG: SdpI family protein [Lachnospiraceae bacterium]|nr:SdpI family protein [Lachnospiraceae bacterium]
MLKMNSKNLIIPGIVTLLPMLIGVYFWNRLPDVMSTHFGLDNEANGFSSKKMAVFGIPLFLLTMMGVVYHVTSRDPKNKNISPKVKTILIWIVPVISVWTAAVIYPVNLGYELNVIFAAALLLGLLCIIIGNYLPKSRQNHSVGIRIRWTLENEANWNKTHRFAGYLWMAGGILTLLLSLTRVVPAQWIFGIFPILVAVPCFYSYWLHAKKGL